MHRRLAKLVLSPRGRKGVEGSSSSSHPPFEDLVKCVPDAIPEELAVRLATECQRLRTYDEMLFGGRRDSVWTDVIDPELCLNGDGHWQACEAAVSTDGTVRLLSWVNHLDNDMHASLLAGLAELLELALPKIDELASFHHDGSESLRGCGDCCGDRKLQLVVGAFEHALTSPISELSTSQTASDSLWYNISNWHVDGEKEERIVATAICYLDIDCLEGGELEFQHRDEMWLDDPVCGTYKAEPSSRMLVAFDNCALRHRVLTVRGGGRRLFVAFHLVDPHAPTTPRASALPRQLRRQRVRESARALSHALVGRSDLQVEGIMLPPELIEHICELAADLDGALSLDDVLRRRDARRRERLSPARGSFELRGTGISYPSDDDMEDVLTGLGPASAAWLS